MCRPGEINALPQAVLSPAERAALDEKFWQLLARQAQRYTRGESSSLRAEMAQELRQSLVYTISLVLRQQGADTRLLLSADLEQLLKEGQALLAEMLAQTKERWQRVCQSQPQPSSQSMQATLAGFQLFFRAYDYPFFAHHIVADIDYQLALPLADSWAGVEYVDEYLRRLAVENDFLRCFSRQRRLRLWQAWQPSWVQLPLNLYEPLAAQALGLILLDKNPLTLASDAEDDRRLSAQLANLSPAQLAAELQAGAARLCRLLPGDDPDYTLAWARTLPPRFQGVEQAAHVLLSITETSKI